MKNKLLSLLFIFLISLTSVIDLFINTGRPATFDGPTHMTDIAGYSEALLAGNFPVFWLDKFGNYGMPVGFFSHQLVLTVAGSVNIILHNPVLTYYIFFFLGIFLANIFFYVFLRLYFSRFPSLAGVTLLTFSAYRITNIYVRGDLPETFSGIFFPLILLGLFYLFKKKNILSLLLISFSYFCLAVTHPMMLVTYSFFIFPYFLYLLIQQTKDIQKNFLRIINTGNALITASFLGAIVLGIGMGLYFLLPLVIETKYLYFGLEKNHLSPQFLSVVNFVGENWFYFYHTDIFPRVQFIQIGSIEFLTLVVGIGIVLWTIFRKKAYNVGLAIVALVSTVLALFMTTKLALPLYTHISALSSLQFPWRMLSVFIFLPPIILATVLDRIPRKTIVVCVAIFIIALVRFPQIYGKNYTSYPTDSYYFTPYNLFPIFMNTIWTGKTEDYPIRQEKIGILQGNGLIVSQAVSNSSRIYVVNAKTPLRLADYTFYFPGWHVYVDGINTPIQFQDPNYRGVITYMVPQGIHTIRVVLQDTAIRSLGKILSLIFIAIYILAFLLRNKLRIVILPKKQLP